jgi:hypothetical protein
MLAGVLVGGRSLCFVLCALCFVLCALCFVLCASRQRISNACQAPIVPAATRFLSSLVRARLHQASSRLNKGKKVIGAVDALSICVNRTILADIDEAPAIERALPDSLSPIRDRGASNDMYPGYHNSCIHVEYKCKISLPIARMFKEHSRKFL